MRRSTEWKKANSIYYGDPIIRRLDSFWITGKLRTPRRSKTTRLRRITKKGKENEKMV